MTNEFLGSPKISQISGVLSIEAYSYSQKRPGFGYELQLNAFIKLRALWKKKIQYYSARLTTKLPRLLRSGRGMLRPAVLLVDH